MSDSAHVWLNSILGFISILFSTALAWMVSAYREQRKSSKEKAETVAKAEVDKAEAVKVATNEKALAVQKATLETASALALATEEKAQIIAEGHEKIMLRVQELETQQRVTSQTILPLNTIYLDALRHELTHVTTPRLDELMKKLGPPDIQTPEEEVEMNTLVIERSKDMAHTINDSERDAATIFPIAVKKFKAEQAMIAAGIDSRNKLMTIGVALAIATGKTSDTHDPREDKP